jgi:hypothetical protein
VPDRARRTSTGKEGADGSSPSEGFRTDLDGSFERLQAGDAEVVQELTEQPYGFGSAPSAIPRVT